MATAIVMPKLGMSMREGRVVSWPILVGARVEKGEPVVVIESEKAEVEVEATRSGMLRHIYIATGETVPCGTLLGAITDSLDAPFDADAFRRGNDHPERIVAAPTATTHKGVRPAGPSAAPVRVPVAPAARALAKTLGIDVSAVRGSGPTGRVTREDVEAFAARRAHLIEVAPGVHLEVLQQGCGEGMLFLPGFGTDVSAFAMQTRAFAATHRVLAVNPRGVGISDAPEEAQYDVDTAAADAAAVLSVPTHIVGASLGAATAIELALRSPERVRSLTLITPFVEASARLRAVLDGWCCVAAEAGPETVARMLLPWLFSPAFLESAAAARVCRGLATACANVPAGTLARAAAGLLAWSGTRRNVLALLRCPTVVLVAGADLLTTDAEAVGRQIPKAKVIVVPAAGHALAIEAADEVTAAIRAHVRAHADAGEDAAR